MNVTRLMNALMNVERQAVAQNAKGGNVRTFATVASGVIFAVAPADLTLVAQYGRRNVDIDYVLYTSAPLEKLIPADASHAPGVNLNDQVVGGGELYLVNGMLKNSNPRIGLLYELHCFRKLT